MSALIPSGLPVTSSAGMRPDDRERQAEQDDERRDERAEREHHHDVDDEDREAHREEQRAEGLVLLGGRAREGHVDRRRGSRPTARRASTRASASVETEPWSSDVMSAETVAAGEPSTRVTDPRTST